MPVELLAITPQTTRSEAGSAKMSKAASAVTEFIVWAGRWIRI